MCHCDLTGTSSVKQIPARRLLLLGIAHSSLFCLCGIKTIMRIEVLWDQLVNPNPGQRMNKGVGVILERFVWVYFHQKSLQKTDFLCMLHCHLALSRLVVDRMRWESFFAPITLLLLHAAGHQTTKHAQTRTKPQCASGKHHMTQTGTLHHVPDQTTSP